MDDVRNRKNNFDTTSNFSEIDIQAKSDNVVKLKQEASFFFNNLFMLYNKQMLKNENQNFSKFLLSFISG